MRSELLVPLTVLGLVALAGIFAPWLAPHDPLEQPDVVAGRHLPPLSTRWAVQEKFRWHLAERVEQTDGILVLENGQHSREVPLERALNLSADGAPERRLFLLGSDRMSRDVFSRLLYGARLSLTIGVFSLLLTTVIGVAVGAAAALGPRWLDQVLMRGVDGMMTFPWLVLLIILVAFFPANGTLALVLLLGCTAWPGVARLVRGEILSLKERDFVAAARCLGAPPLRIFLKHLLPNVVPPLLVDATLRVTGLIILESTLSFLGFGVQPPRPTWGNMIAESRESMTDAWWVGLFPGLALVATVIALAVLSDRLQDGLSPREKAG